MKRILIVDDDALILELIERALEGYEILPARDGDEALRMMTPGTQIDLVITDFLMPTMTGLEICQQLRADPNLKDTPIILLTALEDAGVGSMGEKAGATLTLRKPFAPESIVETVERVLGGKPSPGTL